MALGVPGRLRSQIFSTFGTTRVVGRQPNAPAAFTPGEIPGTVFRDWVDLRHTVLSERTTEKNPQVTPPGIDPGTVWLVAQHLNHYATPGPYIPDLRPENIDIWLPGYRVQYYTWFAKIYYAYIIKCRHDTWLMFSVKYKSCSSSLCVFLILLLSPA